MIRFPDHIPTKYIIGVAGFLLIAIPYSIWLPRHTTSDAEYCLKCHGEYGGLPNRGINSKVHPTYDEVSCVDCHSKPGQIVYEGYVKGFMAEVERVSPNCIRCHEDILTKNDVEDFKYNVDQIGIPHRLHVDMGASCTDCHANVAHDLTDNPTNRPQMEYCSQCHATTIEPCAKCHIDKIPPGPIPLAPPAGLVGDGKALYNRNCSSCHGAEGSSVKDVNLRSKELYREYDVKSLRQMTLEGHQNMPSFAAARGGMLTDDEVRAIIAHLKLSTAGVQANGQALFDNYCGVCHGTEGDKMPTVDLSSPETTQKLSNERIIKAIRVGKEGMPAFGKPHGGLLPFESIVTLAKYTRTLSAVEPEIGLAADGFTLYRTHCADCHGEEGNDVEGTNLGSADYLERLGDENLLRATADGTEAMPPYGEEAGGELTNEEIRSIIRFLKSQAGIAVVAEERKTPMTRAPEIPHEISEDMEDCMECHSKDGIMPVPKDHFGRSVKACKTCHSPE